MGSIFQNGVNWEIDSPNSFDWGLSTNVNCSASTNTYPLNPYGWGYFRVTADRFVKEDVQETLKKIFEVVKPGITMVLNTVEGDKIYIVTSQLIPDVSPNPQMFDPISIPEYKWLAHYESVLLYKAVNGH